MTDTPIPPPLPPLPGQPPSGEPGDPGELLPDVPPPMSVRHRLRRRVGELRRYNPMRLYDPRAHLCATMLITLTIGATLITQPDRYGNTPSYGNLIGVIPAPAWGGVYCAVAIAQIVAIIRYGSRMLWVVVHTAGIALLAVWLVAFVIRYVTDDGTTIVNVVSWSTYLYLHVRSALMIADDHRLRGGTPRARP